MKTSLLVLGTALAVGPASAETLAFYDFAGGTEGEAPETLVNKANPGTYDALVHQVDSGDKIGCAPYWTNSVPGNCVFADASCTEIIARNPMALAFTSATASPASGASAPSYGGVIELQNLATALYDKDRYTIEFFYRSDVYMKRGAMAYVHHSSQNPLFCESTAGASGFLVGEGFDKWKNIAYSIQDSGSSTWDYCSVRNQGWQHYAMTVDAVAKKITFYYRGRYLGEWAITATRSKAWPNVLFGAKHGWSGGASDSFSDCVRGQYTCIRVSDGILEPAQFMRMGAAAFYSFKDAANGTTVETVTNAFTRDFTGTPTAVPSSTYDSPGTLPKFSSACPGKYVWASSSCDHLLCENPQSVLFQSSDWNDTPRASVDFAGLGGRINMMIDTVNEFTIEFFYRHNWGHIQVASGTLSTFSVCESQCWKGNWQQMGLQSSVKDHSDYTAEVDNGGENTRDDGLWHHAAFVFRPSSDGRSKNIELYIDYARDPAAAKGRVDIPVSLYSRRPFAFTTSDEKLRIGRPLDGDYNSSHPYVCFNGYISCYRVVPAALSPDQFMVATESAEKPANDTAFQWRFEESASGAAISTVADSVVNEKWSVGKLLTDGTGAVSPVVSADHLGNRFTNDTALVRNKLSAAFAAQPEGATAVLETREWYGMPSLHPASWTMEAFVKPTAAPASDALVVGRGRLNPSTGVNWYDWALVLQPNGKLGLKGFREDTAPAGEKIGYAFADVGDSLLDGAWHRVAVTYDGETRALSVWTDGLCRRAETLESAQIDNLFGRYMIAQGCGQGAFVGGLDEVRLVGRVLTVEEMTHPYVSPYGLMLIMR